jgi:hypothetical protein
MEGGDHRAPRLQAAGEDPGPEVQGVVDVEHLRGQLPEGAADLLLCLSVDDAAEEPARAPRLRAAEAEGPDARHDLLRLLEDSGAAAGALATGEDRHLEAEIAERPGEAEHEDADAAEVLRR